MGPLDNTADDSPAELLVNEEYHPMLFEQHKDGRYVEYPSFDRATDVFYSELESQKTDMKQLQQEQAALQRLEAVQANLERRIHELEHEQDIDARKGRLIQFNAELVDEAIKIINSAIASSLDWADIDDLVSDAKAQGDPVACQIAGLKLGVNRIIMTLSDPYENDVEAETKGHEQEPEAPETATAEDDDEQEAVVEKRQGGKGKRKKGKRNNRADGRAQSADGSIPIELDLALTAHANARKYFDQKRRAVYKKEKTQEATKQALKSAQRKTAATLKEVAASAAINKARKQYWFEKFLWFLSSENFLVIGGRDRQQNELIVRRHLSKGDIYVHADMHGASSIVIKNPRGGPVPPRTLDQAGNMAVIHSAAWDAKTTGHAWWVYHDQVSKTAPSGEYLTSGSFMIRGKKNMLPPAPLVLGVGILFKVDESCIAKHLHERRPKESDEELIAAHRDRYMASGLVSTQAQTSEPAQPAQPAGVSQVSSSSLSPSIACQGGNADEGKDAATKPESQQGEDRAAAPAFPDTHVEFSYSRGESVKIETQHSREYSAERDDVPADGGAQSQSTTKARLSAKQRRNLRKGLPLDHTSESAPAPAPTGQKKQQPAVKPPPRSQRGKKGKLKKIKKKYADQDEEERAVRMKLLASEGPSQDDQQTTPAEQANPSGGGVSSDDRKVKQGAAVEGSTDDDAARADNAGDPPDVEPAHTKRPAKHTQGELDELASKARSKQEQEEIRKILEDENVQLLDEDELQSLTFLDALTGVPLSDDVLLFAVPVCAPYNTLAGYKYRAKLVPGAGKKGKTIQSAFHAFMSGSSALPRERDLIKHIKPEEAIKGLPGKVRMTTAGKR